MILPIKEIISSKYENLIDNTDLILTSSNKLQPILLNIGESWSQTPEALINFLSKAPSHVHGYLNSLSGFPFFRNKLYKYIISTHEINESHFELFDVFVASHGTKTVMWDFGKLIDRYHPNNKKLLITTDPGWYYEAVFSSLNFHTEYIKLKPENNFLPKLEDFQNIFQKIDSEKDLIKLVVINAQHNPTGNNWDTEFVTKIINISLDNKAYILLDDAYYMVKDPGIKSTSSLSILLEEINKRRDKILNKRWLCVQSLGKQFYCNGWAIGAITASIETLNSLIENAEQYTTPSGGLLQYAMSKWIDSKDAYKFTVDKNKKLKSTKEYIKNVFRKDFGYPSYDIHIGTCTPYIVIAIPPAYVKMQISPREFIREIFKFTGVLFSELYPNKQSLNYFRIYIGTQFHNIIEALERLKYFNFHYNMQTNKADEQE